MRIETVVRGKNSGRRQTDKGTSPPGGREAFPGEPVMVDEIDVWRAAQQLLDSKGDLAESEAARLRRQCERNGIEDGAAFWRRVEAAIGDLRDRGPAARVH